MTFLTISFESIWFPLVGLVVWGVLGTYRVNTKKTCF